MDKVVDYLDHFFTLNILVVFSEKAKVLCPNLDALLKKYKIIKWLEATIREPSSDRYYAVQELRISLNTKEDIESRPNPIQVKKMLQNCVQEHYNQLDLSEYPSDETPWFEAWKRTFLSNFESNDQEFIGAQIGVMFFIAETDLEDFRNILTNLQLQVKSSSNLKWYFPNFLKYCVVLSDKSEGTGESFEPTQFNSTQSTIHHAFNELKAFYDANRCTWFTLDTPPSEQSPPLETVINEDVTDDSSRYTQFNNQDPLLYMSSNADSEPEEPKTKSSSKAPVSNRHNFEISEKMLEKCEALLRKAIIKTILPWCERQLALLYESLASRKGLRRSLVSATKQLLAMSSSTLNQKGSNQSIIYSLEANEMQHRKFADLTMCLGLYDVAYNSYYAARKEFQSEGAWTHYAGASECAALASILLNKFQKHYLEHAISTYLDVAKIANLATRATLIAADAMKDSFPNEVANLFIRIPSDDSDLRSALFLEQAAKCFLQANPPRRRKAAFYYVLAGHRYNRCGLKRLALACYMRYSSSPWCSAVEHVNYTTAKLYLQISSTTKEEKLRNLYREKGLHLFRINSEKHLFFSEYMKEIKKEEIINCVITPHLNVPIVKNVVKSSGQESLSTKGMKQICFLNEPVVVHLTLFSNFAVELSQLKLVCDNSNIICSSSNVSLESSQDQTIKCSLVSNTLCDFNVTGLSFEIDGTTFNVMLAEKWCKALMFTSQQTLPPLDVCVKIGHSGENMNSVELLTGQLTEILLKVSFQDQSISPDEYQAKLSTNANLGLNSGVPQQPMEISLKKPNMFEFQAPLSACTSMISLRISYSKISEPTKDRMYTRNIDLFVRECIQLEGLVEKVASLRNVSAHPCVIISPNSLHRMEIAPGLTGHILTEKNHVDWTINNMKGRISILSA